MLKNKKGLICGIANDHSIAWGIAKKLHEHGAELALTYQNESLVKRIEPLAKKVNWTDKDISNYKRQGKIKKLANCQKFSYGNYIFKRRTKIGI